MKKLLGNPPPRLTLNSTGDKDRYVGLIERSAPASGLWSGWSGLVAYWNLDEASGVRADSINGYDLTDNNTVGSDTGMHNLAAIFVAVNSEYLSSATNPLIGASAVTYSYWIKHTEGAPFTIGDWPSPRFLDQYPWAAGNVRYYMFANDDTENVYVDASYADPGDWHHVAYTFGADKKVRVYVDGGIAGTSDALVGTPNFNAVMSATLGCRVFGGAPNTFFGGHLDEFNIFNVAKDADWVTAVYNAGAGRFYPN